MTTLLLLTGSALCALSVILALIAVARTEAPRSAAACFVLGVLLMVLGAWLSPVAIGPQAVADAWRALLAGRLTVTGPV